MYENSKDPPWLHTRGRFDMWKCGNFNRGDLIRGRFDMGMFQLLIGTLSQTASTDVLTR